MLGDRFLCCRPCGKVHHVTDFDRLPLYELQDVMIMEQPMDDRLAFLERHAHHEIEELTAVSRAKTQGSQSIGPMKVLHLEVSNGRGLFVLRGSRKSIQEPLIYEILPNS